MSTKTAMITIAGRPNVGKSTLTNYLVGEKIAIVSNKPQTTRNRICGIVTRGETQFVFVDTPGYHRSRTKLGDYMVNVARESIADVDATILGGLEVDEEGSLSNWIIPGKKMPGMGGAMDLVTGSKTTIVMTTHCDKAGNPKIVQKTQMPLTGYHCVDYIVSELAVIHITPEGPVLQEISRNTTIDEVIAKTGAKLIIPEVVGYMEDVK